MGGVNTLKTLAGLIYSYVSDARRFWRYSYMRGPYSNQRTLQAHVLRLSHALEKGAALPNPRAGFGTEKIGQICDAIGYSAERWPVGEVERIGLATVEATLALHRANGVQGLEPLQAKVDQLKQRFPALDASNAAAGLLTISRSDLVQSLPSSPEAFFHSRTSVRQFGARTEFDVSTIERAVAMAQKSPSVCNRQLSRAYVFSSPDAIERILKHQDGNKGFGSDASAIIVVTTDTSGMYKTGERNQTYVDGGLFAMSLVYALHALCQGSCMLNWSQPAHKDAAFRKDCPIPGSEVIITLIAVGPLPDQIVSARSPRRPLGDVMIADFALNA